VFYPKKLLHRALKTAYKKNQKRSTCVIAGASRACVFDLLFVSVDFLEILVGINLKLSASSLVAGDNSVLVKL